jgi:hypothetical protein
MHMIDAILKRHRRQQARQHRSESPPHRGKNSRNVYFHIRPDDMIREVPNYAEQYLTEHPELKAPEPAQANPLSPHLLNQRRLPRNRATAQTVWQTHRNRTTAHTVWRPQPLSQPRSGPSRGNKAENHPAPEERQKKLRSPRPARTLPDSRKELPTFAKTKSRHRRHSAPNQPPNRTQPGTQKARRHARTPRKPQSPKNPHPPENQETIHRSSCRRERPRSCSFSQPSRAGKTRFRECLGKGTTSLVRSRSQRRPGFSLRGHSSHAAK